MPTQLGCPLAYLWQSWSGGTLCCPQSNPVWWGPACPADATLNPRLCLQVMGKGLFGRRVERACTRTSSAARWGRTHCVSRPGTWGTWSQRQAPCPWGRPCGSPSPCTAAQCCRRRLRPPDTAPPQLPDPKNVRQPGPTDMPMCLASCSCLKAAPCCWILLVSAGLASPTMIHALTSRWTSTCHTGFCGFTPCQNNFY